MAIRITLIDDSRETAKRLLESLSPEEMIQLQTIAVEPFFDPTIEQAIFEFSPVFIILDLQLTRSLDSGFRVLRLLKRSSLHNIPVIVCSKYVGAGPNDTNRKKALLLGATAAFAKLPFPRIQDFLREIEKDENIHDQIDQ